MIKSLGIAAVFATVVWWAAARPSALSAEHAALNAAAARIELDIRSKDIEFYKRRATEDPQSAEDRAMVAGLSLQRGRETGDMNDYRVAELYADSSLRLRREHNGKAQLTLASSLLAQHKFPEAIAAARTLVQQAPNEPRYRALYAELLLEMGHYDGAGAQFDSLRNNLRDLAVAPRYARYLEFVGRGERARWILRRALNDVTSSDLPREQIAWFHLRMADLELRSGRLRAAERAIDNGLRSAPEDGRLWAAQARLHALRGEWKGVLRAVERVSDRADIATTALAGDAYAALGDSAKARGAWRAAETMARENPEPFNRQWTLFALEHGVRLLEIRELLEREIMIRQDVYGWDQLAMARYLTGDVSAAEQAVREAMRTGTQDANLYFHAALIAKARGDVPLAREFARQALSLNPNFHHRDVTRAQAIASAR